MMRGVPPRSRKRRTRVAKRMPRQAQLLLPPAKRIRRRSASPATVSDRASAEAIPDGAASDVSSPIRRPYMVMEPWDSANIIPYQDENAKYQAKLDRQNNLLSLNHNGPITCLDDESFLPVRESVTQMVFKTAKAVLGLTSYIDSKLLKRCSGFLIGWNKDTKRGTILTSANLLCTKSPNIDDWSGPREYAPDAEVLIHLLDDTTQKGTLINYHKHYNIAVFEVDMNMSTKLASC
ncbi:uncharacterized protein [Miscanthus floridulus]|uniref:uncharacterized protein isoform X1 n=1 Tax=Miscanthus floridulus TaxID=154761 RepID=UPI0034597155